TTIIVAQIMAPRNGCRIHRLETIISPMNSTTSTMRATSRAGGSSLFMGIEDERDGAAALRGAYADAGVLSISPARSLPINRVTRVDGGQWPIRIVAGARK